MRTFLGRSLPLEHETSQFILLSFLDFLMTAMVLRQGGGFEANPVARFFLCRWGLRGMIAFKFSFVAFICVLAQIVGWKRPGTGRAVLNTGTALVAVVVIYGVLLLVRRFAVT